MRRDYLFLIIIFLSSILCSAKQNTVKCDADVVNVRNEATINSKIIDVIKAGDMIKVIEESRESVLIDSVKAKWYKVETKNGKIGWVFSGYISSIDGKIIPFGVKNVIGEWLIDDNDGDGIVKFSFLKSGSLIIKGENSKVFDAKCKWIYHSDKDNIEIIFDDKKQEWQARLKKLKKDYYSSKDKYLSIDEKRSSLIIRLTRNYYNERKKIYENISFPFFGYSVLKRVM